MFIKRLEDISNTCVNYCYAHVLLVCVCVCVYVWVRVGFGVRACVRACTCAQFIATASPGGAVVERYIPGTAKSVSRDRDDVISRGSGHYAIGS